MKITVEYAAQVKRAAGTGSETVELDDDCSVQDLVGHVAQLHGESLRRLILDADGRLHPSILLFVGDDQVRADSPVRLRESDVVTFLSPISGG